MEEKTDGKTATKYSPSSSRTMSSPVRSGGKYSSSNAMYHTPPTSTRQSNRTRSPSSAKKIQFTDEDEKMLSMLSNLSNTDVLDDSDHFSRSLTPTNARHYRRLSTPNTSFTQQEKNDQTRSPQADSYDLREFEKLLNSSSIRQSDSFNVNMDDEDSVRLLKQQLSHVQQIKFDNTRKQKLITDLQKQMDELLKYKDESFHYKNETNVLRERIKLKEEELRRVSEEVLEKSRLAQDVEKVLHVEIEKAKASMSNKENEKNQKEHEIKNLQGQITHLQTELKKLEYEKAALDAQVADMNISYRDQMHINEHNAKQQYEIIESLQIVLTETRDELYGSIQQLEDTIRAMQNEIAQKDDELVRMQKRLDRYQADKQESDRSVDELHQRMTQMRDEITNMNQEANLVTELKKELSIIPELNVEITNLRETLDDTSNALDIERTKRRVTTEETQRLQELNTHLGSHLEDIKSENQQLRTTIEELQKTKIELEFANKELIHYKDTNTKLNGEVAKLKRQREDRDSIAASSMQTLSVELFAIQRLVEVALLGTEQINPEHVASVLENSKFEPLEVIKPVLLTLRNNMADTASECCALRERNKHMQHELENYRVALQEKEHERTETYKEFIAAKRELSEQERVLASTEETKSNLQQQVNELEVVIEQSKLDERNRIKSLYNAYKKLKSTPTDSRRDGSPTKQRNRVTESSDTIAWETLQSLMMDQISTHIVERESLHNEVFSLNAKALSLDAQLERAKQEMIQVTDRMERELTQLERSKVSELEIQRQAGENARESLVQKFNTRIRELEDLINQITQDLNENVGKNRKFTMVVDVLKSEIKGLQHERDRLSWCIRLLARGIRPMRDRISDLREQRKFLETELRHYERSYRGVVESVRSLADTPEKVTKTSFRAAAVAIIASRRLQLLVASKKRNVVMSLGNDRIHLLSPQEVVREIDISQLPYDDDASVQRFLQVCSVLDPKFDATNLNHTLMLTLQDGLDHQIRSGVENIAHKGPCRRGLEQVQKAAIQITRTIRELQRDKNTLKSEITEQSNKYTRLQATAVELETNGKKKEELIEYMEQRVSDLQEENMRLIQPEKYEIMQSEVDKIRKNYTQVLYEREQFKNEFETHVDSVNTYRRETSSLQEEIRDKNMKLDALQRDLRMLKEENSVLLSNSKKHNDILRELEVEKDKYQMMVTELRDKFIKRGSMSGLSTSTSSISELDDSATRAQRDSDIEALGRLDTSGRRMLNSGYRSNSSSPEKISPSFSSVRKRVERDLNTSAQMMKTLNQNNARNTHEVLELDRELRNARAHLAELQSKKMTNSGVTSPFAVSPLSPVRKNNSSLSSVTSDDFDDEAYAFSKRKKSNLF